MKHLLSLLILLQSIGVVAQSSTKDPVYIKAVVIALGELQKGQCTPCLEAYGKAFSISQHSPLSYLRAARCAQMCQDKGKAQAFADKAVEISWEATAQLLQNELEYPELLPLQKSGLGKKTLKKTKAAARASGIEYRPESSSIIQKI